MPTKSRTGGELNLLDTSAALPFLISSHARHAEVFAALSDRRLTLAGHASYETFSVMTRWPQPHRVAPQTAARILDENFPQIPFPSAARQRDVLLAFGRAGLAGGSVYDALVGAVAAETGLVLLTRDRRAMDIYRWVGARVEWAGTQ